MKKIIISMAMLMACVSAFAQSTSAKSAKQGSYRIASFVNDSSFSTVDVIENQDFNVTRLTGNQLAQGKLSTDNYDCLLLENSPYYPAKAMESLHEFIGNGGDLILMGGRAFSKPLWQKGGRWTTSPEPDTEKSPDPIRFYDAFEDYEVYEMPAVNRISYCKTQDSFFHGFNVSGNYKGVSAVATAFPGESEFIPLLEAFDQYGRHTGWAASLLINYKGRYQNSQWALFGIEDDEFYDSDEFKKVLLKVLSSFESDKLIEKARGNQRIAQLKKDPSIKPLKRVRITADGKGFEYEDGRPFYMIGANMCGPGGFLHYGTAYSPELLENTFKLMSEAGVNVLRMRNGSMAAVPDIVEALKEYANKYGVYLFLELGPRPKAGVTARQIREKVQKVARIWKDEPMVLAYDLVNEPYPWEMAGVELDDGQTIGTKFPGNLGIYENWADPGHYSLYQNLNGKLPVPKDPEIKKHYENINNVMETWLDIAIDAIREIDPETPITVGYNHYYGGFPCHEKLDFVSPHIYPNIWAKFTDDKVTDFNTIKAGVTTMDRQAIMWPDQPVCVGEFGFSNGEFIDEEHTLDIHTSSVIEMTYYLYAISEGYYGIMKWMVEDWPMGSITRTFKKKQKGMKNWHEAQGRFGMYYYDGTELGKPKAIAYALRFLRDYIDRGNYHGKLELLKLDYPLFGAGYIYRDKNALFVGDINHNSESLTFKTQNQKPANVMLTWDDKNLTIMSTNDARARVKLTDFVGSVKPAAVSVTGECGDYEIDGKWAQLLLLQGQAVKITKNIK
jgi:hypothetical protein